MKQTDTLEGIQSVKRFPFIAKNRQQIEIPITPVMVFLVSEDALDLEHLAVSDGKLEAN